MRFSNTLVHCKRCPDPAQWAAVRSWEAGLTNAAASSSLVASPPQCAAAARLLLDFLAASYTHEHIVLGNIYAVVAWVASLRRIRTASTSTRRVLWHHRLMWLTYLRRSVLGYACLCDVYSTPEDEDDCANWQVHGWMCKWAVRRCLCRRLCSACQEMVGPCCEKMRFSNMLVHCTRCPDPTQWAAGRSWEAGDWPAPVLDIYEAVD